MRLLLAMAALLAGPCLLGGCIENPELDPRVKTGRPESTSVAVSYGGSDSLLFKLVQAAGRTSLRITNSGPGTVDSVAFLLQLVPNSFPLEAHIRGLPPPFGNQYHRIAKHLLPGRSVDVGVLDSTGMDRLAHLQIMPILLRLAKDGVDMGSPWAGYYIGTFRNVNTMNFAWSGNVRGNIDMWGNAHIGSFDYEIQQPTSVLIGPVGLDGNPGPGLRLWYQGEWYSHRIPEGRFERVENGVQAGFRFRDSTRFLDSLELKLWTQPPD